MAVKTDTLQIKFTTDGSGRVRAELNGVSQDIAKLDQAGATATSRLGSLKGALAGLVGAGVVQYVAQTTMEFQRLQAALATVTGSSAAADREFAKLKQFAATTPYQLNEVVDAFIKLKARGLDPSIDTLRSFGNTAAATGKTLDQFIEAVADAATGQMERLKEFGIVARQEGDKVAFTFQGVTTEVGRNADEVTAYLQRLGDVNFAGGMERQAATLGGAFSNAQDAAAELAASVGNALTPALVRALQTAGESAEKMALFVRAVERATAITGDFWAAMDIPGGDAFAWLADATDELEDYVNPLKSLPTLIDNVVSAGADWQRSFEGSSKAVRDADAALAALEGNRVEITQGIREMNAVLADGYVAKVYPEQFAAARVELEQLQAQLVQIDAQIAGAKQNRLDAVLDPYIDKAKAWVAEQLKAEQAKTAISDATKELIADLGREAEAYGLSKSALLEMEKATRLKAAANDVERAALTQAYDALIAKTRAEEQAAVATKREAEASREAAKALKEWNEQNKVFAGVQAANAEVTERIAEATQQMRADVTALTDELDPAAQAWREYGEAVRMAQAAVIAGEMSGEQMEAVIANAGRNLSAALQGINDATNEEIRRGAEEALDDITRIWLDGAQSVGDGLAEWIGNGFRDGADIAEDIMRDLLTNLARIIIQQKLVIPLQAQLLQGFGFSSGQIQQLLPGFMPQNGGVGGPAGGTPGPWAGGYQYPQQQGGVGGFFSSMFGGGKGPSWLGGAMQGAGIGGAIGGGPGAVGGAILAAVGSAFGPIGTMIGSIVGGLLGDLIGGKDPRLEVSANSRNINAGRVEGQATSQLGTVYVGKDDLTLPGNLQSQELANRIAELDNALAGLLSPDELAAVKARLQNFDVDLRDGQATVENVLNARVNAIIGASEPMFASWLRGISDIEERIAKFAAIKELRQYVADFDSGVDMLANDGLTRLRTQMRNLDEAVETTGAQLAEAIATKDVEQIAQAAEAAKQAVIRRYQAEIELANQLAAGVENAERAMRSFNLSIAQRIAGVGGSQGDVLAVTAANVAATRDNVLNARDTEQALRHLDEFVAAVDQWLQQSRAAVQAWYNEQASALQAQLGALDAEQAGIVAAAQLRAELEAQWAAQYQQQQQEALDAQRRALEEQLRIANEWLGVLDRADAMIRELVQSSANPMSGFGRLALLDADINRVRGEFAANGSAETANQLAELLRQRLDLAGQLYDRPSGEYLAIYNSTLSELAAIRDAARGPAEQAALLQEQLNALTEAGNAAFSAYASADLSYTAEEQARLVEIDAERARIAEAQRLLDEEYAARLKAIDDEARAYYEWARVEGNRLQTEWRDEQLALLNELTGGLPIDEFIAQRQAESTELLGDIRDDLRTFLGLLADNVIGDGGGVRPLPGDTPGDGGPRPRTGAAPAGNTVTVPLAIDFNIDGAKFGRYVAEVVVDKAGLVAPAIKRQMRVA